MRTVKITLTESYNRTYVELKPLCSHHNSPLGRGYNRTYVELKRRDDREGRKER